MNIEHVLRIHPMSLSKRVLTCLLLALSTTAHANDVVRYLHDWRWEGQGVPILVAQKNYFQKAKLDVKLTPGTGSGATIAKVAAGEFDIGFGDFTSLVEHAAKNPTQAPPVAVYVTYERSPAALFVKRSLGNDLRALANKTIAAPAFDGGRKLWPIFADNANVPAVKWVNVDPAKREEMFQKGETDAITGFYFTTMLNLEKRGVSGTAYEVFPFYEKGVRVYGNVIVVNPQFLAKNPRVVERFVQAYHRGLIDAMADTRSAVQLLKDVDPTVDEQLEWRRARLAFDRFVKTSTVEQDGLGTVDMKRVKQGIDTVVAAFKLPASPAPELIAKTEFLPPVKDRMLR
jgi:NitT/TauT family transport system substrate-binding protein